MRCFRGEQRIPENTRRLAAHRAQSPVPGYPEESLYEDMPQSMRRHLSRTPNDAQDAQIENWIIENTDRPVYFTEKRPLDGLAGRILQTEGLLYRVAHVGDTPATRDYWEEYEWHTLEEDAAQGEFSAELILSDFWFAKGRSLLEHGEMDAAIAAFDVSVRAADYTKEAYNNVATACAEAKAFDQAAEYYLGALQDDPDYPTALRNLGQVYLQSGRHVEAYEQFDRLGALGRATRQDVLLTIDCLAALERVDEALDMVQSMIREEPEDPELFKKAGMLYLNHLRQPEIAQVYFQQSFALDPNQPDLVALLQGAGAQKQPEEPQFPTPPGVDIPGLDMTGLNIPQAPAPQLPGLPGGIP